MKTCSKCGHELQRENLKFCPKCGNPIENIVEDNTDITPKKSKMKQFLTILAIIYVIARVIYTFSK